jgi:hypothetical protein
MVHFKVFFGVQTFTALLGNETSGARDLFILSRSSDKWINIVTCSYVLKSVRDTLYETDNPQSIEGFINILKEHNESFEAIEPSREEIKRFKNMGLSGPEAVKAATIKESRAHFFATTNPRFLNHHSDLLREETGVVTARPEQVYAAIVLRLKSM